MRPITKIFLLLVAIFVVYLVWPREPDLREFDPVTIAPAQVRVWLAEKEASQLEMLKEIFLIYTNEFGFSPIAAFRIAQSEATAINRLAKIPESDHVERETRVLPILLEKYAIIRRETSSDFDASLAARNELTWRSLEQDAGGSANRRRIATPLAAIWGALYSTPSDKLVSAADNISFARLIATGVELPDGVGDVVQTSEEMAQNGFEKLKAAVGSPPKAAPRPE